MCSGIGRLSPRMHTNRLIRYLYRRRRRSWGGYRDGVRRPRPTPTPARANHVARSQSRTCHLLPQVPKAPALRPSARQPSPSPNLTGRPQVPKVPVLHPRGARASCRPQNLAEAHSSRREDAIPSETRHELQKGALQRVNVRRGGAAAQ